MLDVFSNFYLVDIFLGLKESEFYKNQEEDKLLVKVELGGNLFKYKRF